MTTPKVGGCYVKTKAGIVPASEAATLKAPDKPKASKARRARPTISATETGDDTVSAGADSISSEGN